MSRPATRQKNSGQRPGLIMLEGKQKRRTSEQKQADDTQVQLQKLEKLTVQKEGLERVANLIDKAVHDEQNLLTNRPKPRPRIVVKPSACTGANSERELSSPLSLLETEPSSTAADLGSGSYHAADEFLGDSPEDAFNYGQEDEGVHKPDDNSEMDESDGASPQSQWQESGMRKVVESARISSRNVSGQKGKDHSAPRQQNDDISGTRGVKNWAKSIKSNVINTLPSQPSVSARLSKSASSGAHSGIRAPQTTPATTHLSTSTGDALSSVSLDNEPYMQGSDHAERMAIKKSDSHRAKSIVQEIVSGSEPGEWVSPPPISPPTSKKRDKKRRQLSEGDADESSPPPSKRARTPRRLGSGVNNKYRIQNLPPGATLRNRWRRVFVSTLAHFAGSYNNPWSIPPDELIAILQEIWDAIYVTGTTEDIEYVVTTSSAVYHLARQALSNWRNGFGAAALAVVTTFFANDDDCIDVNNRILFANSMLHKSRFLFDNNEGDNPKEWTGLWRSPFVLQTFAHHFNFTAGRESIEGLDKEARTALALSGAAVCRILKHVSENRITFDVNHSSNTWFSTTSKGSMFEFNEATWGTTTRRYLEAVKNIPDEAFADIVAEAHNFVKKTPTAGADPSDNDSEFENIASYR